MSKRSAGKRKHRDGQKGRLTIGYLSPWIQDQVFAVQWIGAGDVAIKHGVNLIGFPSAPIQFHDRFVGQRNILYRLITEENLDGLIMVSAALAAEISPEEFEAFYNQYRPLPMVSIGQKLRDVPSVIADNAHGIRSAVAHLIETHAINRIAFVQGPAGHSEAGLRYQTYVDVLAEHGIPLDPNLVVRGDFGRDSGKQAVHVFEERGLSPGVGYQALVAANDGMALGALKTLQAHGVRVPDDVALIGFDDIEEARHLLPPLTTVRNPLYQLGAQAVEVLVAQMRGQDVPQCTVLPSEFVVRRSCGCMPQSARLSASLEAGTDHQRHITDRREDVLPPLTRAAEMAVGPIGVEFVGSLWDGFVGEIAGTAPEGTFILALEDALCRVAASGRDLTAWQDVLSVLHDHVLPYLNRDDAVRVVELLSRAGVFVSDRTRRSRGLETMQNARQTQALSDIEYALSTTFDMKELLDEMTRQVPRSGISCFYIVMFEDPEAPGEWSRLLLAYDGEKRLESRLEEQRFPSRRLLPDGLIPEQRHSLIVEPLYVRDHQFGYALFRVQPPGHEACDVLRRQISGALWGVLLLRAREEAEAALEEAYDDLKVAQEEFLHQERLATLGQVAATVSHEIRNPLATIRISAATVERKTRGKKLGVKLALDRIQRNITRCDSIIAELLDYTRMPSLQFKLVRFDGWLNQVLDEQMLPERIVLSRNLASGAEIPLDVERFRRVIVNLVDNAWQAMVGLSQPRDQPRAVVVGSSVEAGRLKLVIADTGVGIPPDVMPHIFDPLFSTKDSGIGLGLSIVREIVKQHDGEIEIASRAGEGTQVIVWLPLAEQ